MKLRNTLILFAVALGIFGYFWFVDRKLPTTEEELARKDQIIDKATLDRANIKAVTLRNAEGVIEFKNVENNWTITAPVQDRADSLAISGLFTAIEGFKGQSVKNLPNVKESQKEFGVTKGEASITLHGEKNVEILVGKDSALQGKVYARVQGNDTIYLVASGLRDQAVKGIKDWRNRTLSDVTAAQVNKLTLKTAKGEFEIEKQGLNWSFTKPFKARADNQKVADLISNATTARIEDFLTESKDLGAYGLNEPRATLTLVAEGVKEPVVLQVGAAKQDKKEETKDATPPPPPTHVYVKLSTREGVVTVPAAIEELVNKQPSDLRDPSLMRVQSDIVDRITIEAPGKTPIVLGRKGEEWVRKIEGKNDEPANSSAAISLLNELVTVKTTRFVADSASGDLKGFGLDQPTTITLSSYSSEGTPETPKGEKPIVKVLLGKFEGDAGFAKLDDEPFIVSVPQTLADLVWTDPLQWQDLKILELKKEDITGLDITRSGQPALSFAHDKEKGWTLAKGDGTINQTIAQSLVNTLSALRAVRWVGQTDPAKHGLDKPTLMVSYTLADKKTGKLTIGNNAEEMWHAALGGRSGTFVITKLDFEALNASLVEVQKTAATLAPAVPSQPGVPGPVNATTPPVTVPPITPVPAPATPPQPDQKQTPPAKSPEPPKPTEAPSGSAKPASESTPKPK